MNLANLTSLNKFLNSALLQPWTAIYTEIIAIALLYAIVILAMVLIANLA
ncbi:MAG: hypothetical protein AAGF83_25685 [Cyanobacteria bacterium P01_G01_bin.67]